MYVYLNCYSPARHRHTSGGAGSRHNTSLGPPPNPHSSLSPCVVSCLACRCALLPPPPNALSHRAPPSHSLEPHNLVHLRRRRWPAARHPPHTAALLMASRKQDAQPNPIDARTLRTIERVAPQAPEEMLTLTNPNPKVPRTRSPRALARPCGTAAARRSPM